MQTTTKVDASTEVVKDESSEVITQVVIACHSADVKTLLERLEWVVSSGRVKNPRAWATEADLTPQHVHTLMDRLRKKPDAGLEKDTAQALAKAAAVSVAWLEHGIGSPDDDEVVVDQRSETLETVISRGSYSSTAIAAARAFRASNGQDLTEQGWDDFMRGVMREERFARSMPSVMKDE